MSEEDGAIGGVLMRRRLWTGREWRRRLVGDLGWADGMKTMPGHFSRPVAWVVCSTPKPLSHSIGRGHTKDSCDSSRLESDMSQKLIF